ncbi:MAG: GntR family transcriptional regulator [Oscillospiraceae bacterium]|jgi:DNA-binding GntR family transcriptional regulator|nr:GntR family transcriptional regulator [Oscillospiraceae bacterium]
MAIRTEHVYEYIKERILNGTYLPSQRLLESRLSEEIEASRHTIKKALLKLAQENLIKLEDNKGAMIRAFTLDEVVNYLQIRTVLEGLICSLAAKNISDAELDELEKILDEMKLFMTEERHDEYSKQNSSFHNIIYAASKNQNAVDIVQSIKTQMIRMQFRTSLIPGRMQNSYEEHCKIFAALKAHYEEMAEEAMKSHVSNVMNTIKDNYRLII